MSVARSSLVMASGTIASRLLGFVRTVVLALTIGVTTDAADAFGVANQLPNNVYAIIAGGVLSAVLVPQIVKARLHEDSGHSYIDRLLTLAIVVFAAVTVLATLAAPFLVSLYTTGWSPAQLALATAFAYWCLPQLFFYGLYSMLGEVLNARSAFGPYMWAPVLNNVVGLAGLIGFLLIFGADPTGERTVASWSGEQIALLSGSATLGVIAQAMILFLSWKKIGINFSLNFRWRGFGLRPAIKAAGWSLAMVLVSQIGGLVQTIVASRAASERAGDIAIASVAAAAIAWLIFMLPHSVVTVSIATAYFTKMSEHVQAKRIDLMKIDLRKALRVVVLVNVFSSVALIVLALPVSRVFVGEYSATVALGNVLLATMFGLVPFGMVFMFQRAFYALEDTRTPFLFTSIQIGFHILGSIILFFNVSAAYLVSSLAALTSITIGIQALSAYLMLRKRIGEIGKPPSGEALTLRVIAAGAAAAIAGFLALQGFGGISEGSFAVATILGSVATILATGLGMLLAYSLVLRLLKVPEITSVLQSLGGILRR
ncbi:MAG: murein biosynthesis integral membrane protein MurJ [Actinomycetota bacterium]